MRLQGFLWIDAICISQSDVQEKESQVQLMGKVFSLAESVLVWLGPESPDAHDFIWLHNEFLPSLRQCVDKKFFSRSEANSLTVSRLREMRWEDPNTRASSYMKFYKRTWFERAWIIQEVILARKVQLLCGKTFLKWDDLLDFKSFISNNNGTLGMRFLSEIVNSNRGPGEAITYLDNLRLLECPENRHEVTQIMLEYGGNPSSVGLRSTNLMYLAHKIRTSQITDQRDKIYAILGILNHVFPSENDDETFPIKYDCSVATVFYSATFWYLKHSSLLFPLSLVEDRSLRLLDSLPSWVPDFTVSSKMNTLIHYGVYNTSGGENSTHTSRGVHERLLQMPAALLDIVDTVDRTEMSDVVSSVEGDFCSILDFCYEMESSYFNGQDRVEALWRTMIGNMSTSDVSLVYPASINIAKSFHAWVLGCLSRQVNEAFRRLQIPDDHSTDQQQEYQQTAKLVWESFFNHYSVLDRIAVATKFPSTLPILDNVLRHAMTLLRHTGSAVDGTQLPKEVMDELYYNQQDFKQSLTRTSSNRRLFRTAKGFIGIGPRSMQSDDRIFVFDAARVPFVLRQSDSGDSFSLVGEAYVHGLMNGEIRELGLCGKYQNITIE